MRPLFVAAAVLIKLTLTSGVLAATVNLPVGSGVYDDLERLELKGLLRSSLLTTKPITRAEAARLASEAAHNLRADPDGAGPETAALVKRVERRFSAVEAANFLKPADRLYVKGLYAENTPFFASINNNGDEFGEGASLRAGIELSGGFFNVFAFSINPEYRLDEGSSRGRVLRGYGVVDIGGLRIEGGRDSMWWGPGSRGALILSNNARPFDMVKLTSRHPFVLPWIFGRLGLLRPTVFLTRLEEDRTFPRANLLGMRLDFKPTPGLQFGLSRVFMFGGEGRKSLDFSDWLEVFTVQDSAEHLDSPINGNQIVAVDLSYVYVNRWKFLPFSGVKAYTEWGAEDSSGETKTPTGKANIIGALIDEPFWLRNLDLRVEWANTARNERYGPKWYKHAVYKTGYTFYGRVIGHHMGGDSRDLFMRARYHTGGGAVIGVEAERERSGIHSGVKTERNWLGVDLRYPFTTGHELFLGAGVEEVETTATGEESTNPVAFMSFSSAF